MMRIYPVIQEYGLTQKALIDSYSDDLFLTPAERATLATRGAVQINDVLDVPLLMHLDSEPEVYDCGELISLDDYGNVNRWAYANGASGTVQL